MHFFCLVEYLPTHSHFRRRKAVRCSLKKPKTSHISTTFDGSTLPSVYKNKRTKKEYGSLDNGLIAWEWINSQLKCLYQFEGHRLGVISVDINSTGTLAASSSLDSQILLWDLETGKLTKTYDGDPADTWTVAFSPDSRFLATGSHTGCVNMINVQTAQKEGSIQLEGKFVYSLAYISDGSKLAAGTINGLVSICDLETGSVQFLDGHATPVRSVSFSPDGRLLASASDDKQIKVFDVRDGRLVIPSLNGHKGWVVSVDFASDNRHLVTASTDCSVRIWDLASKEEKHCFNTHEDQVWCARYSPQGNNIISVGDDRSIMIYQCA
ncbi:unnamed protein product [Schistosoma margrebowiei]|nr:unnamed protein product [Schistosoma margrebowiei]